MFSDPLSVTFDGSSKSLPRVETYSDRVVYRTADGEFQVDITGNSSRKAVNGVRNAGIKLARRIPDPTPLNSFDDWRQIVNAVSIAFQYDESRAGLGDLDLLRSALLTLVNPTFQSRLIQGEK